jgi:hypothetical protein
MGAFVGQDRAQLILLQRGQRRGGDHDCRWRQSRISASSLITASSRPSSRAAATRSTDASPGGASSSKTPSKSPWAAVAGRELLVADAAAACELDQPQPVQGVRLEGSIGLAVQQARIEVATNTIIGLTGGRG